jgi:hypothetical protein
LLDRPGCQVPRILFAEQQQNWSKCAAPTHRCKKAGGISPALLKLILVSILLTALLTGLRRPRECRAHRTRASLCLPGQVTGSRGPHPAECKRPILGSDPRQLVHLLLSGGYCISHFDLRICQNLMKQHALSPFPDPRSEKLGYRIYISALIIQIRRSQNVPCGVPGVKKTRTRTTSIRGRKSFGSQDQATAPVE